MNNLNIKDRQIGDVIVLDIDGNLRMGEGSVVLHNAIRRLAEGGQNQILLNLAHVSYIDSSGLGELIASHVTLSKSDGQIKLLHLTQRVSELMTITKLLTVFDVYDNESEALDSFKLPALGHVESGPAILEDTLQ
ncbi:MAG TPA: STAS domain-containing protein [Pyrinomonadaceae bacterium]|nr:STAS domain-containing protein [Pyrinomonadaceae bacterium]